MWYQGKALAQFAYKEKGYKTAYVIDDTETYGAGLAGNFSDFFKGFGGTILDHKSIANTSSYENVLTAVAAAHPDVLFFGGNDSTGGITIREQMATTPGLQNVPFLAGDGNKTLRLPKPLPIKGEGQSTIPIPGTRPIHESSMELFSKNFQKTMVQSEPILLVHMTIPKSCWMRLRALLQRKDPAA